MKNIHTPQTDGTLSALSVLFTVCVKQDAIPPIRESANYNICPALATLSSDRLFLFHSSCLHEVGHCPEHALVRGSRRIPLAAADLAALLREELGGDDGALHGLASMSTMIGLEQWNRCFSSAGKSRVCYQN